jgi:AcrR family transcriptional regulator
MASVPDGRGGVSYPPTGRDRETLTETELRVITAAIDTIVEVGYARASSNEILRRAGCTWGVLQHRFGSREKLLVAVLEVVSRDYSDAMATATIPDGPLNERILAYLEILADFYGSTKYLAALQILLNLGHDPETSEETRLVMQGVADRATADINRLQRAVLGRPPSKQLSRILMHAGRGVPVSHLIEATATPGVEPATRPQKASASERMDREVLARALELLIESS